MAEHPVLSFHSLKETQRASTVSFTPSTLILSYPSSPTHIPWDSLSALHIHCSLHKGMELAFQIAPTGDIIVLSTSLSASADIQSLLSRQHHSLPYSDNNNNNNVDVSSKENNNNNNNNVNNNDDNNNIEIVLSPIQRCLSPIPSSSSPPPPPPSPPSPPPSPPPPSTRKRKPIPMIPSLLRPDSLLHTSLLPPSLSAHFASPTLLFILSTASRVFSTLPLLSFLLHASFWVYHGLIVPAAHFANAAHLLPSLSTLFSSTSSSLLPIARSASASFWDLYASSPPIALALATLGASTFALFVFPFVPALALIGAALYLAHKTPHPIVLFAALLSQAGSLLKDISRIRSMIRNIGRLFSYSHRKLKKD